MKRIDSIRPARLPEAANANVAGEAAASKSFLDSLRDTVRNNRTIMAIALVIGIATGCRGACDFGKNQDEAFGCSCTDTNKSEKKKNRTYQELKEVDKSDL